MLQLFTELSLIFIINFKFAERRKAGFIPLIISLWRPFYRPLGSVAWGGRTTGPTLPMPLLYKLARKKSPSNVLRQAGICESL